MAYRVATSKNKTEGKSSFFPVGHGCTRFGSHQESEFKRLFLNQFFILRTMVEFLLFCVGALLR